MAARTADEALSAGAVLAVLGVHGQGGAAAVAATLTGSTALAGPMVGVVLDRSQCLSALIHREILGMCLLALALTVFVGALATDASVVVLLPLAMVLGACAPVVGAGWSSVAVAMTEPQGEANRPAGRVSPSASDAAAYNSAGIVGPAAAGLLLSLGPSGLLAIPFVVLTAAAAAGLLRHALARHDLPPGHADLSVSQRIDGPARTGEVQRGALPGAIGQITRGFVLLTRTARLRRTTTITTVSYSGMGLAMVGLPVHAAQLGAGAPGGGMLLSAVAVGALVGTAMMTTRWLGDAGQGAVLLGTVGVGVGLTALSMMPSLGSSGAVAVLVGVADGWLFTGMLRVRERDLPAAGRTSAYTSAATLKIAAFAVGAGSAGVLAADGRTLLLTAAAVQAAALLAGRLTPRSGS